MLIKLHLFLFQLILSLLYLGVLLVDITLVLAFKLKEFLLGLEDLLLFDVLSFLLGLLYYLVSLLLSGSLDDKKSNRRRYCGYDYQ